MNKRLGMYSAIVTLVGVVGFAVSMVLGSDTGSYLFSLFISWGFVPMICSFSVICNKKNKAAAYTAIAFSSVYAVLVGLVYFAQLTTIRLTKLNEQTDAILNYKNLGSLFFNYDLFGYAFMALSTFFIAFTIESKNKKEKCLKILLLAHGIFAVSCVVMPILGVFNVSKEAGNNSGVIALEFWCAYFIPICILSYQYFKKNEKN